MFNMFKKTIGDEITNPLIPISVRRYGAIEL